MSEQRLGILGGMGPQATQDFYQRILDRTDASCDQEHLPTLIWSDTSMPDRTAAILGGDAEGCYRRLLDGARLLERGGCTALAIPCNTSHYFADRLQGDIAIPLIHMPRETVGVLAADGKNKAGGYPGHRRHGSDRHLPEGVRRPGHGRRDAPRRRAEAGHEHHLRRDQAGREGLPGKVRATTAGHAPPGWDAGHPGLNEAVRSSHLPRPARLLSGRHGNPGGKVYHRLRLPAADGVVGEGRAERSPAPAFVPEEADAHIGPRVRPSQK